MFVLGLIKQ